MLKLDRRAPLSLAQSNLLIDCLRCFLKPIISFCVRNGVKLQEFHELIKILYIECAHETLDSMNAVKSNSRVSILTGVHRKDVSKFLAKLEESKLKQLKNLDANYDLVSRVIGQWRQDSQFQTSTGRPRRLYCEGKDSEFAVLVGSVSREISPYSVLFELERLGAVKRVGPKLRLLAQMYIPKGNIKNGFSILGEDVDDLIAAVEENLLEQTEIPNLHIKTEYTAIPLSAIDEIKSWLIKEGSSFHRKARSFLSKYDVELNKSKSLPHEEPLARIAVTAFSRVDRNQDQ